MSKPDDYQMVNGAQAEWKANADYYAKLDFDSFYRLHKVNMFTIENLGRLVDFYSINVGGEKYLFTLEDLEKTVLEDIKYEQISFLSILGTIIVGLKKNITSV